MAADLAPMLRTEVLSEERVVSIIGIKLLSNSMPQSCLGSWHSVATCALLLLGELRHPWFWQDDRTKDGFTNQYAERRLSSMYRSCGL